MREPATAAQHAPRRRLETISSFSLPRWKYALYSISSVQAWKSRSSQHSQRSPTGKWPPSAPTPWECHRSPPTQDVCSYPSGTPRAGENRRRLSPKGAACKLRSAVGLRSKCDLRGAFSSAAADHSPHVDQPMSTNGLSLSPPWRHSPRRLAAMRVNADSACGPPVARHLLAQSCIERMREPDTRFLQLLRDDRGVHRDAGAGTHRSGATSV